MHFSQCTIFTNPPALTISTTPPTGIVASYTPDLFAELGEPLPEAVNGYRAAALAWLNAMIAVDEFILAAPDARLAVVSVAICLGWPSTRGLTVPEIAEQLGVSTSTITRLALGSAKWPGSIPPAAFNSVPPGAGSSNGDKPAAVRA